METHSFNVKMYSKTAVEILNAYLSKLKSEYNERIKAWRTERRFIENRPRAPFIIDSFVCATQLDNGEAVMEDHQYARHVYRYNARTLSNEIGYKILAMMPGDSTSDIKKRAVLTDVTVLGQPANVTACFAELLLGRDAKKLAKFYGENLVKSIIGVPRDVFVVSQLAAYKDEIDKLKTERDMKRNEVINEARDQIAAITAERDKKTNEIYEKYNAMIDELERKCKAVD